MAKVTSHLWFEKDAGQAVEFYVSTIPNSAIGRTTDVAADNPSGPAGSVKSPATVRCSPRAPATPRA